MQSLKTFKNQFIIKKSGVYTKFPNRGIQPKENFNDIIDEVPNICNKQTSCFAQVTKRCVVI